MQTHFLDFTTGAGELLTIEYEFRQGGPPAGCLDIDPPDPAELNLLGVLEDGGVANLDRLMGLPESEIGRIEEAIFNNPPDDYDDPDWDIR